MSRNPDSTIFIATLMRDIVLHTYFGLKLKMNITKKALCKNTVLYFYITNNNLKCLLRGDEAEKVWKDITDCTQNKNITCEIKDLEKYILIPLEKDLTNISNFLKWVAIYSDVKAYYYQKKNGKHYANKDTKMRIKIKRI